MSDRAFVFVYPPGVSQPLLAGQVIVMAKGNGGYCRFKYSPAYLAAPASFALDPVLLPLETREFESERDFELFNVFRDAAPDYWGRKVMERNLGRTGMAELDFLLTKNIFRSGALDFEEGKSLSESAALPVGTQLADLLAAAEKLEAGEPVEPTLLGLLGKGSGTLGGMRPKSALWLDNKIWIAKFPARDDRWDHGKSEFIALRLAAAAGLNVPDFSFQYIGKRFVLLTRRFDRVQDATGDWSRLHMLSGLTVTGLHERDHGAGNYADIADWLRQHGENPVLDCRELFRRMAFNVFLGNTDDHLRNHAVILTETGYHLSPAYDLVPQPTQAGERLQAIGVGAHGRLSTLRNVLSDAGRFGLSANEANSIAEEVRQAITKWRDVTNDLELDPATTQALEHSVRLDP